MTKISKSKISILGVVCVLMMCVSGIYAFTNISIVSVKNELNTGAVNIEIEQLSIDDSGAEIPYTENGQNVFPGQVISLIPRISNLGDSCYIRAKISYTDSNNVSIIANESINKITENWIKCGDYWYYKTIISPGESIDVFKEFIIPREMTNKYQGQTLQLNIVAEAIQSKNFEPNFNSDTPWGDNVIKKAVDDSYMIDKVQLNSNVKIKYENNAEVYINVPDNFFEKLNNILPGDVITQEITINNTSSDEIEYFIATNKPENISSQANELLNRLNLTISIDNKNIYQGKVDKVENCSLGKYKPNQSAKVQFTIIVPEDLENEYSALSAGINWNFSVESNKQESKPPKEEVKNSPQTGDTKLIIAIIMFFISAISLIILLVVERKMKTKNQ